MDQFASRPQPPVTDDSDHAHIAAIETFGSGGQMLDVLTLTDGRILVITEQDLVLYPDSAAFEDGTQARVLSRNEPPA